MSLENFFKDLLTGNFTNAGKRIEDEVTSILPPAAARFVNILLTAEGNILMGLAGTAVNDIVTGGLSTTSFVAAGKDIATKLVAQNISTFTAQDIFTAINMAVAAQPTTTPVTTIATPAA